MKPTVLRIALVALLLLVQLATVVIVVLGMRNKTDSQFEQTARTSLTELHDRLGERANAIVLPAQHAVATAKRLVADGLLDTSSNATVERYFAAQLGSLTQVVSIELARGDGSAVTVSRQQGGGYLSRVLPSGGTRGASVTVFGEDRRVQQSWLDPRDDSDLRTTDWYQLARNSQRIALTPASQGSSADGTNDQPQPVIAVAVAAETPDNKDAGVFSVRVGLAPLLTDSSRLLLPGNGSLALTDDRGRTIVHLDNAAAASRTGQVHLDILAPIESTIGQPLRSLLADRKIPLVSESAPQGLWSENSGFTSYSADGEDRFGLVAPITVGSNESSDVNNWLLSVQAPVQDFAGELGELFARKLRTLLAVILIPALIAVLAVFGLTEPAVKRTREEVTTDSLTGFLTRDEFRRRLDGMLLNRRELEYGGRIVVVALEMDGFTPVSKRYGREVGDAVLRQFSRRLRARVRQHDLLGRTGTDEFVIALRVDRDVDVLTTVNRIRRATVVKPFVTESGRHLLGVTAGIACVDPNESVDDLLARADQALLTGKARSKNRSYLAAERDSTWPQTGIALPDTVSGEEDSIHRAPSLEV